MIILLVLSSIYLVEAFRWQALQYDGFHGLYIAEPGLGDVQRTNHMTPAWSQNHSSNGTGKEKEISGLLFFFVLF